MSTEFFNFFDLVTALFVLMLIALLALRKRWMHPNSDHYRYFIPSLIFKLFLALAFGAFYIVSYDGGGDTAAYWRGAVSLNNLFWHSPGDYFSEMTTLKDGVLKMSDFNAVTGFPPGWIYSEKESWLICKIFSLFIIPGFKGYFTLTIIISYISHLVSWKFYEFVLSRKIFTPFSAAVATLFIPSVALWCGGISKDTLLYIFILYFTLAFFKVLQNPRKIFSYFILFFLSILIIEIRSVIMVAIVLASLSAINRRIVNQNQSNSLRTIGVRIAYVFTMGIILSYVFSNGALIQSDIVTNMLSEASVVQQDFTNNVLYGDNKYVLDISDYSIYGLIGAMPASIIAGLYRPFINESLSATLIISGIESTFFVFLTLRFFFSRKVMSRLRQLKNDEFLVFLLVISFFTAFFAGFTSIIFGVLVRIRSLALPFFALLLLVDSDMSEKTADTAEE